MEQSIIFSSFLLPLAVSLIISVVASRLTYRNESKKEARREFPKLRIEAINGKVLSEKEIYRFSFETPDADPDKRTKREPYFKCVKIKASDITKRDVALSFICYAEGDFELKRIVKIQRYRKSYDFKNTDLPVLDMLNSNIAVVISKDSLPICIEGMYRGVLRKYNIAAYTADTIIQGKS